MKFIHVLLMLSFVVGCQRPHDKLEAMRFVKERGFFFDSEDFDNTVFSADSNSVFPVCSKKDTYLKSCLSFPGFPVFSKRSEMEPVSVQKIPVWKIKYLETRGNRLSVYLLPPVVPTATDLHPTVWMETETSGSVRLHITPAIPAIQFYHEFFPQNGIRSVEWKRFGDYETVINISGLPLLAVRPTWAEPLLLDVEFRHQSPIQQVLVIDPGHGGTDDGTTVGGFREKDRVLEVAKALRKMLQSPNLHVLLTRETDQLQSLQDRVQFAMRNGADFFISLHIDNWVGGYVLPERPKGLTCYYYHDFSKPMADSICGGMRKKGFESKWMTRRSLFVLHPLEYPSVLLELVNLAESNDQKLIHSDGAFKRYLAVLASEIRRSISGLPGSAGPR